MRDASSLLPFRSHASQQPLARREGDLVLKDFRFRSGETLAELRLHYTTLGTPRRDASGAVVNAVMVLHGTTGSGTDYLAAAFADALFGPGQPLDVGRWFVILPDAIGHGESAKPSDGLRARFPRYDYHDMVLGQREVALALGVERLELILGISMGGMHGWLWSENWPDAVRALLPLVCLPTEIAGRNRMWRRTAMEAIRQDPAWMGGDYERQPDGLVTAARILVLSASGVVDLERRAPTRQAADEFLDAVADHWGQKDANDLLYQLDSSRSYDPSRDLEKVRARVIAVNAPDDYINPIELGAMERLIGRVRHGSYALMERTERGHASFSEPRLWTRYVTELLSPPVELLPEAARAAREAALEL